jgi:O-antigen/teichoic acid export membrane protein
LYIGDSESDRSLSQQPDSLLSPGAGQVALRGGTLRIGGYFIGILASTVSSAMLFRHLGVHIAGQYVTALSLVAILTSVSDLGLTAIGIREISTRAEAERWNLAKDLLGLKLTLTLIGGVAIIAIAWAAYSADLAEGVALAVIGLGFSTTQDNYAIALIVNLRLGWVAAMDLMRNLLTAVFTVALVLLGAHLISFLGISIPVCIAETIATAALVRHGRSLAPSFSLKRWRVFIKGVLPYSAAVAASVLYYRIAILLVSAIANATQLGFFSVSYRVIEVLTVVPGLLVSSAFPILANSARDDVARFDYALRKVFEISLIVGAWVAVSIAIAAPIAISIIGGPTFHGADNVLAVLGIGLGALFVNVVWGYGLLSLGLYRAILAINATALILNIAIVAPLTAIYGARGAAIGTGLTEVIVAIVQAGALVIHGHPLRQSVGIVPKVALAAGAALSPLAISGVPTLAKLAISTAIFGVVVLITKATPAEVFDLLPGHHLRRHQASEEQPS